MRSGRKKRGEYRWMGEGREGVKEGLMDGSNEDRDKKSVFRGGGGRGQTVVQSEKEWIRWSNQGGEE